MSGRVHPLKGEQARAVNPADSVWLSASAGTGKTQVLSARVLRLLLQGDVSPDQILCLTFTKAGAAEMAERVNAVLARWVRLEETLLFIDLEAIGAPTDPATRERARTRFAAVLDCPGGGLRIDTIHAFSQWLLGAFPEEAEMAPGTQPMEDRDRDLLGRQVLADLLADWQATGEREPIEALEALSLRLGPDKARGWLMRCAAARDLWWGAGAWQEPLRPQVEQAVGLPAGAGPESLVELCADGLFDCAALQRCLEVNRSWGTASGLKCAEAIVQWQGTADALRAETFEALAAALFTKDGKPRSLKSLEKLDGNYEGMAARVLESIGRVRERAALLQLVEMLTPALSLGRRFALAWDAAKVREGLIEFDDLIRRAAQLLTVPGMGDWIRYKLDRRFDHILVDEAQDTNASQWSIIGALTEDFFAGQGQHDNKLRTIFVVGDYKQAIFRFQGTSPENFREAKGRFAQAMLDRVDNVRLLPERIDARELVELGLGRSYRTAQPVLDFVDAAIGLIGHESMGLDRPTTPHVGDERAGMVTLWRPVTAQPGEEDEPDEEGEGGEGWLSAPERRMADRIAAQIKGMIGTYPLVKGKPRMADAGDFMVLVRKRRELAGLIVARLHAAGVPVAGVDRLRLGAPLAVKDLLAALRFAAQPLDDLSLACLLVSPLIGWSQDQLLQHGWRGDSKAALWDHLRRSDHPDVLALRVQLDALLARADFEPPQALLHWLLVGPWQGRARLVARLGQEANDPIDELLNAAMAFSATQVPGLTAFLRWFDAGEGELKREQAGAGGLVRVMTVHGSKGLQAPIVILADATGNPDASPMRDLILPERVPGGTTRTIPLPDPPRELKVGRIAEAEAAARAEEREEHWRLLYVAMTRAEEALFIGGALGKRETEPAEDSWYARLSPLIWGAEIDDPVWGGRRDWGDPPEAPRSLLRRQAELPIPFVPPQWAVRAVGEEPRPPRPLAPSAAGSEEGSDPPLAPGAPSLAARRGTLIHRLLERLPAVAPERRMELGANWLLRHAGDLPEDVRAEMLTVTLSVVGEPAWADLFGPGALAEVPLAATVDGQVIAGTADRLLVTPGRILVADFKTARRPPASAEAIPAATRRQMAAYVAALERIYPGRQVEAAVLYTQVPVLYPLGPFARAKESLP
ncbi:double-strand break repair helicase AddA [Croceibacterium sp. TMG7-5b_MA50]|uniref:double-strand break repair helicase AddA n=1 Tax=Croceibacterium sp. TMG7-5b_MA50 TaxID=3121290 RepID=UPI003221BF7E